MSFTGAVGNVAGAILKGLVRLLTLTRIHPNVFTCVGLFINGAGAWLFAQGEFTKAGIVVLLGAVFDLVDGPVARHSNRVTRFGGFLDSVIDRYSDLILLMGMLVWYARIDRFSYIVLTAAAMTGSVLISYARARAENEIPKCKVGFLERPERIVLIIIGSLADRMAAVLWVIAVLANWTVIQRILFTWTETTRIDAQESAPAEAKTQKGKSAGSADLQPTTSSVDRSLLRWSGFRAVSAFQKDRDDRDVAHLSAVRGLDAGDTVDDGHPFDDSPEDRKTTILRI